MKTIYDFKSKIKVSNEVNYVELEWDREILSRNNKQGIFVADLIDKKVKWFHSKEDVSRYFVRTRNKPLYESKIFELIKLTAEERVYDNLYFCMAFAFNEANAARNFQLLSMPIKSDKGHKFKNVEDAAAFISDKGLSSAKSKTIVNSLKRNLKGETKTSYGMKWSYWSVDKVERE